MPNHVNRPLAAEGLTSYRYQGRYGWIMIGARDANEALREASRSTGEPSTAMDPAKLQVWRGGKYQSA